jgi:ribosomal-protein-alanine N-acetyltransferase
MAQPAAQPDRSRRRGSQIPCDFQLSAKMKGRSKSGRPVSRHRWAVKTYSGGRKAFLIETKRLFVRPFEPADYRDIYEYISDPVTYLFEPGKPLNIEETKELIAQRSMGNDFWAVILRSTSKVVGHLYFKQIEPNQQLTWELGYIFSPKYQGKGYASEAAEALVEYAFKALHAHRIMARCNPENRASWKLLERIGFVREGHFRKAGYIHSDVQGNPIWNDVYEYSKLEGKESM